MELFSKKSFGLKDSNGKLLYVGDSVKITSDDYKEGQLITTGETRHLEFRDGVFGFKSDNKKDNGNLIPIAWWLDGRYKVVKV